MWRRRLRAELLFAAFVNPACHRLAMVAVLMCVAIGSEWRVVAKAMRLSIIRLESVLACCVRTWLRWSAGKCSP